VQINQDQEKEKYQATSIYVQKTASWAKKNPMSYQDYVDKLEKKIRLQRRVA
jgi:hypothetical protein